MGRKNKMQIQKVKRFENWLYQNVVDHVGGCDPKISFVQDHPDTMQYPFNGVALQNAGITHYLRTFCEYDFKNRQACMMACRNSVTMMFNWMATSTLQMKIKCRCPKVDGVRACGLT